jgi:hypothetical protein
MEHIAEGEVILSGANLSSGGQWTLDTGRIYYRTWTNNWGLQAWPSGWDVLGFSDHLRRREMVFVDDVWLRQVLAYANLTDFDGSYYVDEAADRLYMRLPTWADIDRSKIEIGTREHAYTADARSNLTVRGFTVEKCATQINVGGAFKLTGACVDPLVEDCTFRLNNTHAANSSEPFRQTWRRCHFDHNGLAGCGDYRARGCLMEDCTNNYNNWTRGLWGGMQIWSDGMKFWESRDVTLRRFTARGNNSAGIWFDTDNKNVLVEDCLVEQNARFGLYFEIMTGHLTIRRTRCADNEWGLVLRDARWVALENVELLRNDQQINLGAYTGTWTEWDTSTVVDNNTQNFSMERSTLWGAAAGDYHMVGGLMSQAQWDTFKATAWFDRNTYYSENNTTPFQVKEGGATANKNFADWKTHLGASKDANSTYTAGPPTNPRLLP